MLRRTDYGVEQPVDGLAAYVARWPLDASGIQPPDGTLDSEASLAGQLAGAGLAMADQVVYDPAVSVGDALYGSPPD